jgi:hypothetical protein
MKTSSQAASSRSVPGIRSGRKNSACGAAVSLRAMDALVPISQSKGPDWVTGGKTLNKHMSSGLLRIADMVESADSHRTG